MHLVEVDPFGAEPPEGRLDGPGQVSAVGAPIVGSLPHGHPALGGEHDPFTPGTQGAPGDLFGHSPLVDVRGVDEVAAYVQERVHQRRTGLLVRLVAKRHGAQAQGTDAQARPS